MAPKAQSSQDIQAERLKVRSKVGRSHRNYSTASDEEKAAYKRDLVGINIAAYAHQQLATAPKLTQEQIDRIVAILREGGAP